MEFVTPVTPEEKPRKCPRNPKNWKKTREQIERYRPAQPPTFPKCGHNTKSFRCATLTRKDVRMFHSNFYRVPDKKIQDEFILKFVETHNVKQRREREIKKGVLVKPPLERSTKYFVRNVQKELVPVCAATFLGVLDVSRFRVNRLTKTFHCQGYVKEKRGGFKQEEVYVPKRGAIMNFINQFKCVESHYCRGKTVRKYLPSELNITKMYKMYSSNVSNPPVKLSMFRHIFNTRYNLSFDHPRKDVCSTCLSLSEQRKIEKDPEKQKKIDNEKTLHRLRYQAFFSLLKDPDDELLILSYDCQKNLPLPKVPDQSTYYSRQVYFQNFTIVQGHSKSNLDPSSVTAYCWIENEYSRDSNLIASCVINKLNSIDFSKFKQIRLLSDGCAGQNKNSTIVAMLHAWLLSDKAPPHIPEVEVVFPITGHSFLPADRVFGMIEKRLVKLESIIKPETIYDIIKDFATVKHIGKDLEVADFRSVAHVALKPPAQWSFKISQAKRIFVQRTPRGNIRVRGEFSYRLNGSTFKSIIRSKKENESSLILFNPDIIEKGNKLSLAKFNDVRKLLLAHFGPEWQSHPDLDFYKRLKTGDTEPVENYCEPTSDDDGEVI